VSEERKKILEMIAQGKVTPEEGERLLAAMGESAQAGPHPAGGGAVAVQPAAGHRWLRIHVDTSEGERVRVNVPWKLAKFAINFIPKEARARLGDEGFDVSEIIDGIVSGAADGEILSVDTNQGDKIRIVVE
jgi:hypothetical protein